MKPRVILLILSFLVAVIFYFSNPGNSPYDYTYVIALAFLEGKLGPNMRPPSWLNEMIPWDGSYYSVFPLGSVLTMLPMALLKKIGLLHGGFPARLIVGFLGGAITWSAGLLALMRYRLPQALMLAVFPTLCTWTWTNLAFGGAWQQALGFCLLGQLLCLYFCLRCEHAIWAGFFFALAFGHRTETILLAPLFMLLLLRRRPANFRSVLHFCICPFVLGIATLLYNYARFRSPFDFGYSHIPGVLKEPWYHHGIFSLHAIGGNAREMLWTPWKQIRTYPYWTPTGFGGSIFLATPLLIYLFRKPPWFSGFTVLSWLAILLLTAVLWCHGNPGGWQFSYRYAMVMLPWMYLIFLETTRFTYVWITLWVISLAINAYAAHLFLWTTYVQP